MTDHELLQKKYERLLRLVGQMRGSQREYVKYYARSDLMRMRRLQGEVDRLIESELKELRSKQAGLKFEA